MAHNGDVRQAGYLLSSPGVFSCVETGQVFILFEDVHLPARPAAKEQKSFTEQIYEHEHINVL